MTRAYIKTTLTLLLLFITSIHSIFAQEIKPFKEVFIPKIEQTFDEGHYHSQISIQIPKNYYLYQKSLTIEADDDTLNIEYAPSIEKTDPYFGKSAIYNHNYPAIIKLKHQKPLETIILNAQGCLEGVICYPPERFTLSASLGGEIPQARTTNNYLLQQQNTTTKQTTQEITIKNDGLTEKLQKNYLKTLPWLFLLGIGLSFTACAYPLIPIITGFILGEQKSPLKKQALIASYVLGMALAFALIGAIFSQFNQLNLQALLQKKPILLLLSLIFILFALSLFDLFHLNIPKPLQRIADKISAQQQRGSITSALTLGAISILIISPCATPVVSALLLYSTQTTLLQSSLALFIFGIGMGFPLFLFASALRRFMPKAGAWMQEIKKIYAFLMLAIAIYLLNRLIPAPQKALTWSLYFILLGISLINSIRPKNKPLLQFLAALAFVGASVLAQKGLSPRPPALDFENIATLEQLNDKLKTSTRPTLVDFYADWCVECQAWEDKIWRDPEIQNLLKNHQRLKIDLTDYTTSHQQILRELDIIAPPTILLYPAQAQTHDIQARIIGEAQKNTLKNLLQEMQ